ncbi:hypothetical protein MRX96_053500 [Rhipicephalus microplus]
MRAYGKKQDSGALIWTPEIVPEAVYGIIRTVFVVTGGDLAVAKLQRRRNKGVTLAGTDTLLAYRMRRAVSHSLRIAAVLNFLTN